MCNAELVSCQRFIHSWTQVRDKTICEKEEENQTDILREYRILAQKFQQKIQLKYKNESDQWNQMILSLNTILRDLDKMIELKTDDRTEIFTLPLPSDLRKRKEKKLKLQADTMMEQASLKHESIGISRPHTTSPQVKAQEEVLDLKPSDFSSMLDDSMISDTKLSTNHIRQRLGLIDRHQREQKFQSSLSEIKTLEEQENLQSDMMNLAKTLKERTQSINQSLSEDAKILDAVGQSAESSAELLEREHAALKKQLASSIGFWTSIWLVLMLICVFILMYIYIKLFSRRFE